MDFFHFFQDGNHLGWGFSLPENYLRIPLAESPMGVYTSKSHILKRKVFENPEGIRYRNLTTFHLFQQGFYIPGAQTFGANPFCLICCIRAGTT